MDTSLFLDINRFAERTGWAHGAVAAYASYLGLCLLAAIVVWSCSRHLREVRLAGVRPLAAAVWAGAGAVIAYGLNQPLSHLIGRPRPFVVLHGVEVLVTKANDFSCPSDHAVIAGAVIAGLVLARDRLAAVLAAIVGVALCFARVYVGVHYPIDVLAGLGFGACCVLVLSPLALRVLTRATAAVRLGPGGSSRTPEAMAARPLRAPASAAGTVRVLSDRAPVPQRPLRPAVDEPPRSVTSS